MMVIGVDPHKQSHTAVAAGELGRKKAQKTVRARRDGHRELIAWAREIAPAGRLAVEDVRHVAGGLIREWARVPWSRGPHHRSCPHRGAGRAGI